MARSKHSNSNSSAATVGYEAELWKMADALRGSIDADDFISPAAPLWFFVEDD